MSKSADARPIFIYFGGTGEPGHIRGGDRNTGPHCLRNLKYEEKLGMNRKAVRIYFEGCHHPEIGGKVVGGDLDPDLNVISGKLRECFNEQSLNLTALRNRFPNTVRISTDDDSEPGQIDVSEIVMSGYSRGGVTCFRAAQDLDELGIPMHAFAQDPVPGNTPTQADDEQSLYQQNKDLTQLKNLNTLVVSLGRYFNKVGIQNYFFRQMIPETGKNTKTTVFATNRSHHIYLANKLVLCELEHFLREHNIASSENYKPEELDPHHHRMLRIPNSEIHPHLHGGDLREIPDPPSQIEFESNRVKEKLGITLKQDAPEPLRKALFRLTLRDQNPDSVFINLLRGCELTCKFLIQIESYILKNIRGKNISDTSWNVINQHLKEIDSFVYNVINKKDCNAQSLFNEITHKVDLILSRGLPCTLHSGVQSGIRAYLSTNPLKLDLSLTKEQEMFIAKKRCSFTTSVISTSLFAVSAIAGPAIGGYFLFSAMSSLSAYAGLMIFIALVVASITVLGSVMTDQFHPRRWTLLPETSDTAPPKPSAI